MPEPVCVVGMGVVAPGDYRTVLNPTQHVRDGAYPSRGSNATKALRHMMLHHPSWEVPRTTAQHPDEAAETLLVSVKELMEDKNIVKKNSESAAELKRGALRAVPVLNGVLNLDPGGAPRHAAFVNDFKTERWGDEIKQLAL